MPEATTQSLFVARGAARRRVPGPVRVDSLVIAVTFPLLTPKNQDATAAPRRVPGQVQAHILVITVTF